MNSSSALAIAQQQLLTPFGLDETHLEQIFASMFNHDLDYADLYFQYCRSEAWSLDEGIVKSGSFNIDQGVGIRSVSGEKTAFAYSDDISMAALQQAATATRAIGRQGGQGVAALVQQTPVPRLYGLENPLASLDEQSKVALLEKLERLARSLDPRVVQVMASLAAEHEVVYIARHDGYRAADVRPLVRLSLQVIVEANGQREQGASGGGGRFDYGYFDDAILLDYARQAVDQAVLNLDARSAPAGEMSVVLGPGWPGVLLHEAVGHGLEGDFNRKGSSAFSGRIGEQVAAPGVTVIDDGRMEQRRGSLNVDDEGQPTQRTVLIENGVLRGYLQDSLNARLMGVASTGNGRRESYAALPMPRMTNTLMLAGDKSPEEILGSIKRGLYATNFGGGQVDITSGRFVFNASEAWWVENGKPLYPVKGASLIGNGPEVLKQVSMIGNDLALDCGVGNCGKEGQTVPVGVGQPTLRIDGGLTVGGTG